MVKTVSEALTFGYEQLKNADIESFHIDSLILLCHVLNCDKTHIIVHKNDAIKEENFKNYVALIEKRKSKMPVKYLTGSCEFMSLDFKVNKNVLIPRPDTEILVEKVISDYKGKEGLKILDLCSGSGCIGISLALNLLNSFVTLVDVSAGAIETAKENIKAHKLEKNIRILKKDILKEALYECYDIIVSNPPYINEEDFKNLSDDVKLYEPRIALLSEDDEYKFYKRIISDFYNNLSAKGTMYLEMGYNQSEFLFDFAKKEDKFKNIEIIKDLSGINRVLKLTREK